MQKIIRKLFLLSLLIFPWYAYGNYYHEVDLLNFPNVLNAAQKLPKTGTLQKGQDDFIYLKVSDDYSNKLYPLLLNYLSAQEQKCLMADHDIIGEHITLSDYQALSSQQLKSLPMGKTFSFKVVSLYRVIIVNSFYEKADKTVWYVLGIKSAELSKFLKQHFPSARDITKLHISIAAAKYKSNGACYRPPYYK
jgi:hypothetical protein